MAGVVALLLSARPDLKGRVDEIEAILEQTAVPLTTSTVCGDDVPGESVPNNVYGHGRVDALAAVTGDPDGDGVDNLTDCRPVDGEAWAEPTSASGLTLTHEGGTTLTWEPSTAPGGTAVYRAVRSTSPDDFATATCLEHALENAAADIDVPEAVFYYLVQVENGCGATAGLATDGLARSTATCP